MILGGVIQGGVIQGRVDSSRSGRRADTSGANRVARIAVAWIGAAWARAVDLSGADRGGCEVNGVGDEGGHVGGGLELVVRVLAGRPARLGRTKLVLIDGPSGAGKTTFADTLAPVLGAEVVHTDDLLDGWGDQFTYWTRLESEVLQPIRNGGSARYQKYDWEKEKFAEWAIVEPAEVLIVEGVGAARAREMASLTVFVDAPEAVRLARSMQRDGVAMQPQLDEWRRREALHFAADGTAWRADVVIGSEP